MKAAQIARDLFNALDESAAEGHKGIGLGASQIGHLFRVFVMDMAELHMPGSGIFINPELVHVSSAVNIKNEGCLSWEHGTKTIPVRRSTSITLKAHNEVGQLVKYKLYGLPARCALHELDHLNGINIADQLR